MPAAGQRHSVPAPVTLIVPQIPVPVLVTSANEGQAGRVPAPRAFQCTFNQASVTNPRPTRAEGCVQHSAEVAAPGRHPQGGFLLPPTPREKLKPTVLISTSGS